MQSSLCSVLSIGKKQSWRTHVKTRLVKKINWTNIHFKTKKKRAKKTSTTKKWDSLPTCMRKWATQRSPNQIDRKFLNYVITRSCIHRKFTCVYLQVFFFDCCSCIMLQSKRERKCGYVSSRVGLEYHNCWFVRSCLLTRRTNETSVVNS